MIEELLSAAAHAGLTVREARLDDGEVKAMSGLVTIKGEKVLFLDLGLPEDERARMLAMALGEMDLENLYLSPAARAAIESAGSAAQ